MLVILDRIDIFIRKLVMLVVLDREKVVFVSFCVLQMYCADSREIRFLRIAKIEK